ncbi:uncharacterized protein LOC108683150 [Hyalella azteca]|uniref:Uncharacterized protein LOC108683150 n=1 Tax=Hyalella azteca TaxID=294128 RepID=A0A8B7PP00_HYAAZ|nr:uncharacterized protein LOC108683150 [Hyalella azteca]XP_047739978.1 uncharacterized protein LOC108683150 [Hyalella azteca]
MNLSSFETLFQVSIMKPSIPSYAIASNSSFDATEGSTDQLESDTSYDLHTSGNHDGSQASGNHDGSQASGNHDGSKASGNHDGSKASGNHDGSKASGNHDGSKASGNHDGSVASGNHDGSKASGNHDGPWTTGNYRHPYTNGNSFNCHASGRNGDHKAPSNSCNTRKAYNCQDPTTSGDVRILDGLGFGPQFPARRQHNVTNDFNSLREPTSKRLLPPSINHSLPPTPYHSLPSTPYQSPPRSPHHSLPPTPDNTPPPILPYLMPLPNPHPAFPFPTWYLGPKPQVAGVQCWDSTADSRGSNENLRGNPGGGSGTSRGNYDENEIITGNHGDGNGYYYQEHGNYNIRGHRGGGNGNFRGRNHGGNGYSRKYNEGGIEHYHGHPCFGFHFNEGRGRARGHGGRFQRPPLSRMECLNARRHPHTSWFDERNGWPESDSILEVDRPAGFPVHGNGNWVKNNSKIHRQKNHSQSSQSSSTCQATSQLPQAMPCPPQAKPCHASAMDLGALEGSYPEGESAASSAQQVLQDLDASKPLASFGPLPWGKDVEGSVIVCSCQEFMMGVPMEAACGAAGAASSFSCGECQRPDSAGPAVAPRNLLWALPNLQPNLKISVYRP